MSVQNLMICLSIAWLRVLILPIGLMLCVAGNTWAEDEESSSDATRKSAIYLPLRPQFVVNYGGGKRLKYLKAEVSVRLNTSEAANSVRHHLPYIRNNMVLLFARQTDQTLTSQEGKEVMRIEALEDLRVLLKREDDVPGEDIVDVLFNSLTWH